MGQFRAPSTHSGHATCLSASSSGTKPSIRLWTSGATCGKVHSNRLVGTIAKNEYSALRTRGPLSQHLQYRRTFIGTCHSAHGPAAIGCSMARRRALIGYQFWQSMRVRQDIWRCTSFRKGRTSRASNAGRSEISTLDTWRWTSSGTPLNCRRTGFRTNHTKRRVQSSVSQAANHSMPSGNPEDMGPSQAALSSPNDIAPAGTYPDQPATANLGASDGHEGLWRLPASASMGGLQVAAIAASMFLMQTVLLASFAGTIQNPQVGTTAKAAVLLGVEVLGVCGSMGILQMARVPSEVFRLDVASWRGRRGWLPAAALGLVLALGWEVAADCFFQTQDPARHEVLKMMQGLLQDGPAAFLSTVAVSCLVGPLKEEILFRAFLLGALANRMPFFFALLFSSVLFAAAHGFSRAIFLVTPLAMILGCVYAWTGNLMAPLAVHGAFNSAVILNLCFGGPVLSLVLARLHWLQSFL